MSKPKWVETLLKKYTSGIAHAFILHFNVHDYVVPGVPLQAYLSKLLVSRDVIAFYNLAEGITFPTPSMRDKFINTVGLNNTANDPNDPLAALMELQGGQDELPRAPGQALLALERLLKSETKSAVIIEAAEAVIPNGDIATMSPSDRTNLVTIARWGRDPQIMAQGNIVILITENLSDIHPTIRAASSKYESIEISLPDEAARREFIETLWKPEYVTPQEAARLTAGLSLIHIEDVFLRAEAEGALSHALISERKKEIIATEFGEVLEIMEPRFGWEMIGGLEYVKDFFTRSVIRPMREGRYNRVPMGVLMTGPAGTGKTAVAEAVAFEAGVNFVILNLARILGQYVGQSERNLEKALRAIESLAPCGVFIDEIDQAVNRGSSGDSGVSNRIFKRLLEFMSDTGHRGRIIFLAATNRPDLMDAALRRPGRFDKKIPFLVPDETEREAIFKVMLRKYDLDETDIPDECVQKTEGWTGAEIEAAVVKAAEVMEDRSLDLEDALVYAVNAITPSTADIEFMTYLAIRECNDKDLLPPQYRSLLNDRKALEAKIAEADKGEVRRSKREL